MPLTSFSTALTGLNNNSYQINIIGDNLANLNTTAFKASKADFAEVLAGLSGTSSNGNPMVNGLGSALNGITHNNTQGTMTYTGKSSDAAINGNGFFIVSTDGGMGYTRSGKLSFDKYGDLYNSDGYNILGWMALDGKVDTEGELTKINIQKAQVIPGNATTLINLPGNIDALSSSATTSVQIFDSLGATHNITFKFTGSGTARHWTAEIPAVDVGGLVTDLPHEVGSGDLTFSNEGILITPPDNPTFDITGLANGAGDMHVTIGVWDASGKPQMTNLANGSSTFVPAQNGIGASILKDIKIDPNGLIMGVSEGGNTVVMAQLAVADFPNVEGLQKVKGSTFVPFPSSGDPSIGIAGTGGRGSIVGGSLEQSNVDMAQELVNLMVAQRAYLANSKMISTTDELYQDSLNLKR
jgi:flagellar hook protein FlgE